MKLRWYGFEDTNNLPARDVVQGAHLLLKVLVNAKRKSLDPTITRELGLMIARRQAEIETEEVEIVVDSTTIKLVELKAHEAGKVLVYADKPTYLFGWTDTEIEVLKETLGNFPVGFWTPHLLRIKVKFS